MTPLVLQLKKETIDGNLSALVSGQLTLINGSMELFVLSQRFNSFQ